MRRLARPMCRGAKRLFPFFFVFSDLVFCRLLTRWSAPRKRFFRLATISSDDTPETRETMGVPRARTARVAPTLCLVVALVASAAAVRAEPPEDALVSAVQDALQTHARGDVDAALGKYDAIVADAPAFARLSSLAAATVLNNAGGIVYMRGDANAALAYFERAVRIHPRHAESLVNLAVCQSEDFGKHDEALVAAREAVRLRANHAKSHHVLGNVLQRLGQMPEAHLRFETAEALARGTRAKPEPGSYRRPKARRVGETRPSGVFSYVDETSDAIDGESGKPLGKELRLETLSVVPPVFRVAGFLSPRERARIVALARPEMERSRTVSDGDFEKEDEKNARSSAKRPPRRSSTAWLAADADVTTRRVRDRAADLLGIPWTLNDDDGKKHRPGLLDERLQVLRYEKGGYFDVHHESTAFLNRFATILYYLDGPGFGNGGQTAFPLGPSGVGDGSRNVTAACAPESAGVLIDPVPGDAVLFFNLDENGDVDPSAIHAACEVAGGEKWAANHWFNVPERRPGFETRLSGTIRANGRDQDELRRR